MARDEGPSDNVAQAESPRDGSVHRIIQLTDCHLFSDPTTALRGIVTWPRFEQVVDDVRHEFPDADLLVLAGDTAHDERPETYEAVRQVLGSWCDRLRIIPGNHDNRAALVDVFPSACRLVGGRVVFELSTSNGWRIIGLDSQLPGEVAGSLEQAQLQWLRDRLDQARDLPTLLVMHHPPFLVDSPWLDQLRLRDADELTAVVADHPQVRLVSCGHVHQEAWGSLAGAVALTTSAVGPPFRARTTELEIEPRPPCYRLLELRASGAWRTQVISLRQVDRVRG